VEKYDITGQATDDNIIGRMHVAFLKTKATSTRSENVIFLAFSQQQWLYERAPMAFYKYITCLVIYNLDFFFLKVKLVQECKVSRSMLDAVHCINLFRFPTKIFGFFSNNPEFRSVCLALNGYFGLLLQI
jgi:hypothetical protein